jgi:hypothetical protein
MEVDDIISYHDLVTEEKAALQKGMNFGVGKKYSLFLMSLRENAPYADALDEVTGMLTYEGHDEPLRRGGPNPKEIDQPLTTPKGSWTENGKFFVRRWISKVGSMRSPDSRSIRNEYRLRRVRNGTKWDCGIAPTPSTLISWNVCSD